MQQMLELRLQQSSRPSLWLANATILRSQTTLPESSKTYLETQNCIVCCIMSNTSRTFISSSTLRKLQLAESRALVPPVNTAAVLALGAAGTGTPGGVGRLKTGWVYIEVGTGRAETLLRRTTWALPNLASTPTCHSILKLSQAQDYVCNTTEAAWKWQQEQQNQKAQMCMNTRQAGKYVHPGLYSWSDSTFEC